MQKSTSTRSNPQPVHPGIRKLRLVVLSLFLLGFVVFPLRGESLSAELWRPAGKGTEVSVLPESGGAVLRWNADFRKGGETSTIRCRLPRPIALRSFRFQVRSECTELTVRFSDSTGKTQERSLPLTGDTEIWQCVDVPLLSRSGADKSDKSQSSSGKKISTLSLLLSKTGSSGERATLRLRDFQCLESGSGTIRLPLPTDVSFWSLNNGPEFKPGTKASFESNGKALILKTDAGAGGDYAALHYTLPKRLNVKALHFKLRGRNRRYAVRLIDSSGQYHNYERTCSGDAENEFPVSLKVTGSRRHWGGKNDGVFHGPLAALELVQCGRFYGSEKKGETAFSDIQLETDDPEAFLPDWKIPDPLQLFREPGDKTPVEIRVTLPPELRRPEHLQYSCRDYRGAEIMRGTASYEESKHRLLLPSPADLRGFFEYDFPLLGIRFGMVVDTPPPSRPDFYFGMDSSFSWGDPPADENGIRTFLQILKKNGIHWNRDRLSWSSLEKKKGDFDFGRRYGLYRRLAAEERIRTLDTFHDAPLWTGARPVDRNKPGNSSPFPEDLFAAGGSWRTIVSHWKQDALEVWNEPDIGFGNFLPAEYVTALSKTLSRFLSEAKSPTILGGGVFASPRPGTNFYRTYVDNGLLEDSDFISFHTYGSVAEQESTVAAMRETERESGTRKFGIPYWITESGKPRPYSGTSRGMTEPDLLSAVEIVGKAAEFRALGVERHFAFEYKFRKENANNFGLMDFHQTPMRAMAAYTHLVRVLSHREYVGDLRGGDAFRARVFEGEKDLVAVLYNGRGDHRKAWTSLPKGLRVIRATGIDGRPLSVRNGKVSCADGIAYVYIPGTEKRNYVNSKTKAMQLYRLAKSYRRTPRAANALVLQPMTDLSSFILSNRGFYVPNADELELKVRIRNFGKTPRIFTPELEVPAGTRILRKPDALQIGAGKSADLSFRVALAETNDSHFQTLRLKDVDSGATPIAFSLAPFRRAELEVPGLSPDREIPTTLSELKNFGKWIDFSGPANWTPWEGDKTVPDIEARFQAFHTPEELVFLVLVKDARHVNANSAFESWRGDSVQLTVQQRSADRMPSGKNRFHEITASRCRDGNVLYAHIGTPKGVLKHSRLLFHTPAENWFLYEIRLNGKELGLELKPGSVIGSSMLVNSNPGTGRAGFLNWGFGISPEKNDALFQILLLK